MENGIVVRSFVIIMPLRLADKTTQKNEIRIHFIHSLIHKRTPTYSTSPKISKTRLPRSGLSSGARLPEQTFLNNDTAAPIWHHIHQDLVHRLPPMLEIQRTRHHRSFDEGSRIVSVGFGKTLTDEHGADPEAVVAG